MATGVKAPVDDPAVVQLFTEFGIIHQLLMTRFERALPEHLTASQFGVLNHFVRLGGIYSPGELARAFQVTKGAMTNTLAKLEEKQFVRIQPNPADGRAKQVSITAQGRRMRERALAATSASMSEISDYASRDAAVLLPRLQRLRKFLDEHR